MSTPSPSRKAVAGAVAAVSIGLGGLAVAALDPIGTVLAQEDPSTTTTAPATTEPAPDEAPDGEGRHGREGPWREWREGGGPLQEVLDGLVEDGTLTQEQADAVTDGLRAKVEEWRDEHGGERGPGILRGLWEEAAAVIGVEPDALRDGLRDGQSLAEIAADAGIERQELVDALVAKGEELLDTAVEEGVIDEERAAEIEAELPEHVERLVDATPPGHR
jgi:polyhydroxyalkanoate synthesis regulator phasin